mgnify:CR=1 FL=1
MTSEDDRADRGVNAYSASDESGTGTGSSNRRSRLGALGAVSVLGSLAGCVGGGDGDDSDGSAETGDADDGTPADTDGDTSEAIDPEQRVIELRALLKEFEGGYEQSVLDRAESVRQQHTDSVVFVDLRPEPVPYRLATGWFVDEHLVVTVKRALESQTGRLERVTVFTAIGREYEATVVERHQGVENLALLEVETAGSPIDRSRVAQSPPEPNEPLVQIGHHDEYGHWVATIGDYIRTQTFDASPTYIDEHWSNVHGLPGTGGAPVFDLDGQFVGMTNGAVARDQRGDAPPEPLNEYVYDWQMSHREWFNHLDAQQTLTEIDSWL